MGQYKFMKKDPDLDTADAPPLMVSDGGSDHDISDDDSNDDDVDDEDVGFLAEPQSLHEAVRLVSEESKGAAE